MPITIVNKTFTDIFGVARTFYLSNSGDRQYMEVDLIENISVQSSGSIILSRDVINSQINWLGGNFYEEGFRVGDTVQVAIYDVNGNVISIYTSTVNLCNANILGLNFLPFWYDSTNNEIAVLTVYNRKREGLRLNVNHVANGSIGGAPSLIDGESTTLIYDMSIGAGPYISNHVGNKSGQFAIVDQLALTSATLTERNYTLRLEIIQSGIYDQNWFSFSNCLKVYLRFAWQSLVGEPYSNLVNIISDDADSGWYNQAFNQGIIDATLVQGINAIDYSVASSGTFVIDSASLNYGFGSAYISSDDNYYKSQIYDQSSLSMIVSTSVPISMVPYVSDINPQGASYQLLITGIAVVGTISTISYTFTPTTLFTSFIESLPEQDRLFYVWARYGNVNLLVFNDQLTKIPAIGGPLILVVSDYLDHSENITDSNVLTTGYEANVEDDLAFVGKFRIPLNVPCTNLTVRIEAFETVTQDKFTLQQTVFNISSVPQVLGKYILNEVAPIFSQFQVTSKKRDALLVLDPTVDIIGEYGVKVYFPFLYRWEYWLNQVNANNDFYPNQQTRNWVPYGNTGNWELRLYIELIKDSLSFNYSDVITIKDYDSDPNILQTIELFIDATNQPVTVVTEGQLMRVVAYHKLVDNSLWIQNDVWGQITIEPTESSPRYWSSTAVPWDLDTSNPLYPLSGLFCDLTFPSPDMARLECYFDPTILNLSNGVKITTKIKGCYELGLKAKIDTFGVIKTSTNNQAKTIT